MWIPHKPRDLDVEANARDIVEAARDAEQTCPEGAHRIVGVKFKSAEMAERVTDCLVGRYGGAYEHMVRIELLH